MIFNTNSAFFLDTKGSQQAALNRKKKKKSSVLLIDGQHLEEGLDRSEEFLHEEAFHCASYCAFSKSWNPENLNCQTFFKKISRNLGFFFVFRCLGSHVNWPKFTAKSED